MEVFKREFVIILDSSIVQIVIGMKHKLFLPESFIIGISFPEGYDIYSTCLLLNFEFILNL